MRYYNCILRDMLMKRCGNFRCKGEFIPREAKQKFCCRECSIAFFQNERREAVAVYRQQRERETAQEQSA